MVRRAIVLALAVALVVAGVAAAYGPKLANVPVYQDSTWSIVAFDPSTGELGVIVQTNRPAVANRCPWAEAGVGAVSTQAWTNPLLASRVLGLLAQNVPAEQALATAIGEDVGKEDRQIVVVDYKGNVAAWTGTNPSDVKGHILRENFAVAGNILASWDVLEDTADAFEAATGPLAYRLLEAMEAGQAAGGDVRGQMSIGIIVTRPGWVPFVDLRVDHNTDNPFAELRRILDVAYNPVGGLGWSNPYRAPQLGYRPMGMGDIGVDVNHVQVMLRDLGYYKGAITGVYDGQTNAAVRAFQRSCALKLDGVVYGDTLENLVAAWLAIW